MNSSPLFLQTIKSRRSARRLVKNGLITLVSIGCLIKTAYADRPATFWTTASGDFFDSSNWSLGSPGTNLDAKIDNGGIVRINTASDDTIPYVFLGSAQNSSGTLEVTSGGVANFTTMIVGALNATGKLNITGGGKLTSFGGPIGSDYLGVGIATIDGAGSSWKVTGAEMVIGGNGVGTVYLQNSSSLTVANGLGRVELADHPLAEGTLSIGNGGIAGTLSASEIYNGEGMATVIFNHSNAALTVATKFTGVQTVRGYLDIIQQGSGTTILSAPESNLAGKITVSGGTLLVTGKIMGSVTDVVVDEMLMQERTVGETLVTADGTLGGTGFIEGKTTIQGRLSPGIATGILKFGGDLSLSSTSTVKIELGGTVRGTQFDAVDVAGVLAYAGTLRIDMLNGFVPSQGLTFDLFNGYSSYSGTFANIEFSSGNYAGAFDPVTGILSVTTIPEPGILGLAAIGMATLGLRRRNRGKQQRTR
ncbi:MAG: autotransporter outer rane beta-barrel protein [Chthoniobacteraceae bacterium]|nr:autotransporter outer rane beta-barrel protein [Chthoniobacteraceae bacterium]